MSSIDESREQAIQSGASMKSGSVNFNYVDTTKLERLGISRYDTKKPKGNNFIRIIISTKTGPFAREIWKHSNVGADGNTYLCLEKMFNKKCPVCDYIRDVKKDDPDNEIIKDLAPQRRFLLFVVDTASKDTEAEGPKWFDCPSSIYQQVCSLSQDKRTGKAIDPTDPVNGRDIEFTRVDGKRTSYGSFLLRETEPIPESWYKGLPSFDEILLIPDENEVARAVSGISNSGNKEEATREARSTRESRKESPKEEVVEEPEPERESESKVTRGDAEQNTERRGYQTRESTRKDSSGSSDSSRESVRKRLAEIEAKRQRERGGE